MFTQHCKTALAELALIMAGQPIHPEQVGYWTDLKYDQGEETNFKISQIGKANPNPEVGERLTAWICKWRRQAVLCGAGRPGSGSAGPVPAQGRAGAIAPPRGFPETKGGTVLTTIQVAAELGITPERVRVIIKAGGLKATRFGPIWIIEEADLADYQGRRRGPGYPKGRPRKPL